MSETPDDDSREEVLTAAVITFPSPHHAFQAEKVCQNAHIPVILIPLPRELSADCGVALLLSPRLQEQAEALLRQAGVTMAGTSRIARRRSRARLWQRVLQISEA
jgi:hypothetical protein